LIGVDHFRLITRAVFGSVSF